MTSSLWTAKAWVGLLYSVFDMATTVAALVNAVISNDQDQGVSVLLGLCACFGIFGLGVDTFLLCKFGTKDPPDPYPPGGFVWAVFGQDLSILCVEVARGRGMLSTQSPIDVLSGAVSAIGAAYNGCKVMGEIIYAGTQGNLDSDSPKLILFLLVTAALGVYTAGRWATTADTDANPGMYALFALFQVIGFMNLISFAPKCGA